MNIWQGTSSIVSCAQFILGLVILLALLIFWVIWKRWASYRGDLLSQRVEAEVRRIFRHGRTGKFQTYIENLYIPSVASFITILLAVLVFFGLANISCLDFILPSFSNPQNLIAAHAGVGTIIFALLIFVAESLRDEENKDRAQVLLRESFLFPLTVACILVFFMPVGDKVNLWNVLPVVMVAIGTISGLWRLLAVLLNRAKFNQKRSRLFKGRIQQSIDLAIRERIGNNLLAKELGDDKTQLRLKFFSLDEMEEYHCFWLQGPGTVGDIHLGKLREFADEVEREANKNGFSFIKDKVRPVAVSPDLSVSQSPQTKAYQHCDRRFLLVKYREALSSTSHPRFEYEPGDIKAVQVEALAVDKRLLKNPAIIERLGALASEIFVVNDEDNFSEELKLELSSLKDQFIVAIEEKRIGKIGDELFKMYVSFAEAFLERLNAYGGGYSHKQAREERTAIMGGWTEVRWLYDGVREIYLKAVETESQQIISEVIYLPIAIAARAINWGDQYVYQEFIKFPSFLYWLGLKRKKPDVRDFMVHRSWTYLREMADFYIENSLSRKERIPKFIPVFKDFAIPVLAVFQELLKTSFDKNQVKHFKEMLKEFNGLFRHFNPEHDHPDASDIRRGLDFIRDEHEKERAKGRLALQEEREKASAEIRSKRQEVIFGLSAWILEQCHQHPKAKAPKEFFDLIEPHLPADLVKLTDLFMAIRNFEVEDFWGWDNWDMPGAGEAYRIDFHSKLDQLYCVKALQILSNMTDDKINNTVLAPSRGIAFLAEDRGGPLLLVLNAIAKNQHSWPFVLSSRAGERVDALRRLLVAAKKSQEDKDKNFIRAAEIDPGKLGEFKKDFLSGFNKTGKLRKLVIMSGAFEDHTRSIDEKAVRLGFKQISQKEAFIKEWHVHFSNWGEQFGSGMSRGEDLLVFESLLEKMGDKRSISKSALIGEVEAVIRDKKLLDPIILQTLEFRLEYDNINRSDLYVPHYRVEAGKHRYAQVPGFMGFLKILGLEVPIIDLQSAEQKLENKVIVTDLKMVGIWKQFCPLEPSEPPEFQEEEMFVMQVSDLNANDQQRNRLLAENPLWLQEYTDREGYLRRNVLINFRQRLLFEVTNPSAGACISISDDPPAE